jgi:AcrR family transcriptional regulator
MRVTRKVQEETRTRLLEAARALFVEAGYRRATTREVAQRAGVAAGTLFNYFATKESLGAALLLQAAESAAAEFDATRRSGEPFEELLFAWAAIHLRHLEPFRPWTTEVLDPGTSLLRASQAGREGDEERFRREHLERVATWLARSGRTTEQALDLHLYWTLFLGALEFWTGDESPHQEATLALLDRSMQLFARSVALDTTRS